MFRPRKRNISLTFTLIFTRTEKTLILIPPSSAAARETDFAGAASSANMKSVAECRAISIAVCCSPASSWRALPPPRTTVILSVFAENVRAAAYACSRTISTDIITVTVRVTVTDKVKATVRDKVKAVIRTKAQIRTTNKVKVTFKTMAVDKAADRVSDMDTVTADIADIHYREISRRSLRPPGSFYISLVSAYSG